MRTVLSLGGMRGLLSALCCPEAPASRSPAGTAAAWFPVRSHCSHLPADHSQAVACTLQDSPSSQAARH